MKRPLREVRSLLSSNYQFWIRQANISFQVPLLPDVVQVANQAQHSSFYVENLGNITIFKVANLLEFRFSSHLPISYFRGCAYEDLPLPSQAWILLNNMKNTGPVRFIVTNTPINLECSIELLSASERGGDVGSIYYDIALKEYRRGAARQVTVMENQAQLNNEQERPDNRMQSPTYTVVSGDSLWKISKRQLGDASRWPEIATLNRIDAKYIIMPGQVLQLPT